MGFRLQKASFLELKTPDEVRGLATQLDAFGGTDCEREEKERRKRTLKAKVLGGEMLPFRWATGEVVGPGLHKGTVHRVDGQHSSAMFLELTDEEWAKVSFPVFVQRLEFACDAIRDLPILFEQFDPSWSSRNADDLVGAHKGIYEDLAGLDRHVINHVTRGMSWYLRKVLGHPKEKSIQFEIIHNNHDTHAFLIACCTFLQKRKTEEMFHPAVIGAIRHTFAESNAAGLDFWKRVSAGTTWNEEGSGAHKLALFLEMLNDRKAEWPRTQAKHFPASGRPTEVQIFTACLNAYRRDVLGHKTGDIFDPAKGRSVKEIAAEFDGLMVKTAA